MIPEVTVASKVAALLGRHIPPYEMSEAAVLMFSGKCVANRRPLTDLLASVDQDPARLGPKGIQLRQQQTAELSDEDHFLEEAAFHRRGYEQAMRALSQMGSVYAREYDPDEVAQDREDDRLREQRQDEAAADAMPKGLAS